MAAETLGTGTADDSKGTRIRYGMMDSNPQVTTDPQTSHSGTEVGNDSLGTMPPVSNVDPGGCQ